MRVVLFTFIGLVVLTTSTRADDARIEVARLDGAPVYHWRLFRSQYDDVDRALILREFPKQRVDFPQRIFDEGLAEQVAKQYGGDEKKLIEKLHQARVTLQDYKAFVREEIIITAMIRYETRDIKGVRDRWLASLKKHAKIERRQ